MDDFYTSERPKGYFRTWHTVTRLERGMCIPEDVLSRAESYVRENGLLIGHNPERGYAWLGGIRFSEDYFLLDSSSVTLSSIANLVPKHLKVAPTRALTIKSANERRLKISASSLDLPLDEIVEEEPESDTLREITKRALQRRVGRSISVYREDDVIEGILSQSGDAYHVIVDDVDTPVVDGSIISYRVMRGTFKVRVKLR